MLEITIKNSSIISTDKTLESKSQENKYEDETIDQNKIKKFKWYFRWNNWQIKIIWWPNRIVKKIRRSKRVFF